MNALLKRLPWSVSESGWSYNGPFSTYKELHAGILGLAAGYIGDPKIAATVVAYATGRATKGSNADTHWRQIAEEPAYALGAMTVGRAARNNATTAAALDAAASLI